ncbi:hypothetical protein CCAX7_002790 [Capsulimonas corticalis]|uniref:Uncharacterized protein n=1 Tax=Capsulimonas corticalis TaxID=2219043 RepID=A0A402CRV4_9BACT|nr:hypothetical protein [Capsulimonas corticalis]BDI28228.1 hypothetical protein CCAX7_002790 [Capsulimonas corticalis]
MKTTITAILAVCVLSASAFAATPKAPVAKKMAATTMTCPACKMPMPIKKSAATPVPVKIGAKTYYCCAGCPAGKEAMAASAKKMPKMGAKKHTM